MPPHFIADRGLSLPWMTQELFGRCSPLRVFLQALINKVYQILGELVGRKRRRRLTGDLRVTMVHSHAHDFVSARRRKTLARRSQGSHLQHEL